MLNAASSVRSLTSFDTSPTKRRNHSGCQLCPFDIWKESGGNEVRFEVRLPGPHHDSMSTPTERGTKWFHVSVFWQWIVIKSVVIALHGTSCAREADLLGSQSNKLVSSQVLPPPFLTTVCRFPGGGLYFPSLTSFSVAPGR